MLAKVLHAHLDGMEEIEARVQDDIDIIISAIDVKELMSDPNGTIMAISDEIKKLLEDKYIPMAAKDGIDLLATLERYDDQGKEIVIDGSKDPKVNA